MRSACDRSTACFASWNGASGFCANRRRVDGRPSSARTGAGAAPRAAWSARNAPIWNVTKCGAGPCGTTSAVSLPWNIGRTNAGSPPAALTPVHVGDERAIEPRRQLRREVARLVGVRQQHERRRRAARSPPAAPPCSRPACTARARRARRVTTSCTCAAASSAATPPASAPGTRHDDRRRRRRRQLLRRRRSLPTSRDSACRRAVRR